MAVGEYLVFLDGDDALTPWALDMYDRIVQARKPMLILGNHWWFRGMLPALQPADTPHEIRIVEYEDILRRDRPFGEPSTKVIDRQAFQDVQGWSPDTWPMEHTDLLLRLCACGRTILIFTPRTNFYRRHPDNDSANIAHSFPALHKIIDNERSGEYVGGKARRFERQAVIGGRILTLARRAAEAGLHGDALKVFGRGWPMALAAVTRRLGIMLKRRKPCETINM
jgi:hypothetical protein